MASDRSEGWDGVAEQFMAARSDIGASLVRRWARDNLPSASAIVDVGCGSGVPIAEVLLKDGFAVFGIDASPTLLDAFRLRFPGAICACEAAQESTFFNRRFDAAVSIGLLFLLSANDQRVVLQRMANAIRPGGRLLFSTPRAHCEWQDSLTGRHSISLGQQEYERLLEASGLRLTNVLVDEGQNDYFDAAKVLAANGS